METIGNSAAHSPTDVYDRVVREARRSYGHLVEDEIVVSAAREAVDELLVQQQARVTAFVPVLAMRRIRETIPVPGDAE
jgi:hypothetical protein